MTSARLVPGMVPGWIEGSSLLRSRSEQLSHEAKIGLCSTQCPRCLVVFAKPVRVRLAQDGASRDRLVFSGATVKDPEGANRSQHREHAGRALPSSSTLVSTDRAKFVGENTIRTRALDSLSRESESLTELAPLVALGPHSFLCPHSFSERPEALIESQYLSADSHAADH